LRGLFLIGRIPDMQVRIRFERGNLDAAVRSLAGRERLLVLTGVAVMAALGGAHLLVWEPGVASQWSTAHGWLVFGMWAAVMVATMAPAAASTLLAYARDERGRETAAGLALPAFLAGHFALWMGISGAAALAHWGLHALDLLSPDTAFANPAAGGILLMGTGAYLITPLKAACLARDRSPTGPPSGEWRDGALDAFVMGLRHAMYCLGRCWLLIVLLFIGGALSPLWIVVLTLIAMAEKILPYGESIAHGVAVGAIGWGLWMLAGTLV
jgi:predicted metal-binding membrane protein